MKCTGCGEREGVVSLTQIEDGEVRTGSLCARCAAEKGLDTGIGLVDTPLGEFIAALGDSVDHDAPLAAALEARCPGCGATLKDFRETGRVGCAECYTEFDPPLRELLRRLHGSTHHTGMRFVLQGTATTEAPGPSAPELREQLRRAVEAEQFERAAELRDQLRERE